MYTVRTITRKNKLIYNISPGRCFFGTRNDDKFTVTLCSKQKVTNKAKIDAISLENHQRKRYFERHYEIDYTCHPSLRPIGHEPTRDNFAIIKSDYIEDGIECKEMLLSGLFASILPLLYPMFVIREIIRQRTIFFKLDEEKDRFLTSEFFFEHCPYIIIPCVGIWMAAISIPKFILLNLRTFSRLLILLAHNIYIWICSKV